MRLRGGWGVRPWLVPLGLAVAAMMSGCSGGSGVENGGQSPTTGSTAEPYASLSVSPSSTPAVGPPPYPEAATKNDEAGQEAFVRHWFDVYNYGIATGDTTPVKELSQRDELNALLWDPIDKVYVEGGHIVGHTYNLVDLSPGAMQSDGSATVGVTITLEPGAEEDAAGATVPLAAVGHKTYELVVRHHNDQDHGRWRLISVSASG